MGVPIAVPTPSPPSVYPGKQKLAFPLSDPALASAFADLLKTVMSKPQEESPNSSSRSMQSLKSVLAIYSMNLTNVECFLGVSDVH